MGLTGEVAACLYAAVTYKLLPISRYYGHTTPWALGTLARGTHARGTLARGTLARGTQHRSVAWTLRGCSLRQNCGHIWSGAACI